MERATMFSRLRGYLERGFGGGWPADRNAQAAVRQLSSTLMHPPEADGLGAQLTTTLRASLRLRGVALYLQTPDAPLFKLAGTDGCIDAPPFVDGQSVIDSAGGADGQTLRWATCVPIRVHGSHLGLIALAPKQSRAAITDADVTLLTVIAAQLGMALQNAQYAQEISRQKAAIDALQKRLRTETEALRAEARPSVQFAEIIGTSAALHRALALVEKVASTDASILVTGETGTGKELIARAVHHLSPRRAGPLVSVNCPAIPAGLAESELFGHERGAFTDAIEARPGKFELANGGTIFLDEIADLPPELQVKLLRVLQEHECQRVGGRKIHRLDLRVIAATNRDLRAEMHAGRFREDLYYRLAAVVVHVPPLRVRTEDIPMLASHFLDRAAAAATKSIAGFSPDAMTRLRTYEWPGNVRELQHVVERAVLLCPVDVIQAEHLMDVSPGASPAVTRTSLRVSLRAEKLRRIQQALEQTGGNQAAAARLLGISPSNLKRLLRSLRAQAEGGPIVRDDGPFQIESSPACGRRA